MNQEANDPFQVSMISNEPVVKQPKALPDSTTSFVKDSDDPRLKQTTEVNTWQDLLHMAKEMELLAMLMQTNINNLIKKDNKGTYADELSLRDSLGADIPF